MKNNLKIALDLDDTIFGFYQAFNERFPNTDWSDSKGITRIVESLKYDRDFWSNLPLIRSISGFEPTIYATKRINPKSYTRQCLLKHNLPLKPIYQIYDQADNKARIIKGKCDVLIDDSYYNCIQAISSGLPALLIDGPQNQNIDFKFRIFSLDINEILSAYKKELKYLKWN